MKNVLVPVYLFLLTGCFFCGVSRAALPPLESLPTQQHPTTEAYPGWHLAVQSYTFKKFNFLQAVDKAAELGLDFIEVYPNHKIGGPWPNMSFKDMDPAAKFAVREKLETCGVRIIGYGVVRFADNNFQNREIFDLAREWGIQTITAEPALDPKVFDEVEKLCQEYQIKVAIHNHPKSDTSLYWNPDTVAQACQGRSKWIGACADIGHWMRSGIHPVEALRKLEGRIISLHLKDLNEFGNPQAHDVPWGSGKADIPAILKELHRQKFQGFFSIEYEHNWENSLPEIRQCLDYFNQTAGGLNPSGWRDLLAPDLSNAEFAAGAWNFQDGVLTFNPGQKSSIFTTEKYGNFILDFEYKLAFESNSGVFLRVADKKNMVQTGIEVQLLDSQKSRRDAPDRHDNGAVYDCLAPTQVIKIDPGQWYHMTLTAVDNKIYVVLNGRQVIDMDLNQWTEAKKNPDGSANKFKIAYKDMARIGYIALQDHKTPVWFRHLRIKPLP